MFGSTQQIKFTFISIGITLGKCYPTARWTLARLLPGLAHSSAVVWTYLRVDTQSVKTHKKIFLTSTQQKITSFNVKTR